jgi:hypothetical protein
MIWGGEQAPRATRSRATTEARAPAHAAAVAEVPFTEEGKEGRIGDRTHGASPPFSLSRRAQHALREESRCSVGCARRSRQRDPAGRGRTIEIVVLLSSSFHSSVKNQEKSGEAPDASVHDDREARRRCVLRRYAGAILTALIE